MFSQLLAVSGCELEEREQREREEAKLWHERRCTRHTGRFADSRWMNKKVHFMKLKIKEHLQRVKEERYTHEDKPKPLQSSSTSSFYVYISTSFNSKLSFWRSSFKIHQVILSRLNFFSSSLCHLFRSSHFCDIIVVILRRWICLTIKVNKSSTSLVQHIHSTVMTLFFL